MILAFLCGLEKAPTFLVPIINPPFADNSPHLSPRCGLAPDPFFYAVPTTLFSTSAELANTILDSKGVPFYYLQ